MALQLQLTWAGHSALRVEYDGFTMVIDPGLLSAPDAAQGADALLISHEHLDHYDVTTIAAAVAAKPGLPIWTNKSVAAMLAQSGAGTGADVHVIGDGDAFDVGGIPVQAYGEWHAPIHPEVPLVRNVGFLVDGRLFHPGDAFTDPGVPIELLLVPLHGFYTKGSFQVDYIKQLMPTVVSPIHDATLDASGLIAVDTFLARNPSTGPGTGVPYSRQPAGQPVNF
jgi:L-ascorbate metabolism protein UlaG (beta-lactamase superfamily)